MNFKEYIFKYKNNNENRVNKYGVNFICHVSNGENDYLHIVFPGLQKDKKADLIKFIGSKNEQYVNFLLENNGAILYSGAIALFGFCDESSMDFSTPTSMRYENATNYIASKNPNLIYIGNLLHRELDNVDIYIDKNNGNVIFYKQESVYKTFMTFNEFINHILDTYDSHYYSNGINKDQNNRSKNVYGNTQLY